MWEELYERHFSELKNYACRFCMEESLAEDIVQEVFLKSLRNAHIFDQLGPSQRRAWLFKTLKNEMRDRFRRARLEQAYLENTPFEEGAFDPGIQKIENAILLGQLTREDRTLFHLRYEEGYTAAELAELYGVPAGTIRSRLSRCRQLLKTMILEE